MNKPLIEAYDDGFFPLYCKGGRCGTFIVGVETEEIALRRIAWTIVMVDTNTSLDAITRLSRSMNGEIIVLDGITYAGFDVVDPHELSHRTGKGVIVIQQYPLDLEKIRNALERHFTDWKERYAVIERIYNGMVYFTTPWREIKIYLYNVSRELACYIIRRTTLYSPVPEPLRIADKIASSLSRLTNKTYPIA